MKKHILIFMFLFNTVASFCQYYGSDIEPKEIKKRIEKFKKTTLLVTLDDEQSSVGQTIIASFDKYWKFTKYEFINTSDLSKYVNNASYSHFIFAHANTEVMEESGYAVYLGTKRASMQSNDIQKTELVHFHAVHDVPWNSSSTSTQENCEFVFSHILLNMQSSIQDIYNDTKYEMHKGDGVYYYGNGYNEMHAKTLLILDEIPKQANNVDTSAKRAISVWLNKSPDSILFVSREQIRKAIEENDKSVIICYSAWMNVPTYYSTQGIKLGAGGAFMLRKGTLKQERRRNRIVVASLLTGFAAILVVAFVAMYSYVMG